MGKHLKITSPPLTGVLLCEGVKLSSFPETPRLKPTQFQMRTVYPDRETQI